MIFCEGCTYSKPDGWLETFMMADTQSTHRMMYDWVVDTTGCPYHDKKENPNDASNPNEVTV